MALSNDDAEKDWYAVLGVPSKADAAEIKRTYRKLARSLHPDKNPGDAKAEAKFKDVSRAYDILGDEAKRKEYDEMRELLRSGAFRGGGSAAPAGAGVPFDLGDLLGGSRGQAGGVGDLFGGLFGRGRGGTARVPTRGEDVSAQVTLSFEQAMTGAAVSVRLSGGAPCATCHGSGAAPGTQPVTCPVCSGRGVVSRNQGGFAFAEPCRNCGGSGQVVETPCPTCHGSGTQEKAVRVRVPAGVADGQTVRVRGRGRIGQRGGPPGDLNVTVQVQPHPVFGRDGVNLTVTVPVTFAEAALGATVRVPTLDEPVLVKIAPGTATGTRLRVRDRGFPTASKTAGKTAGKARGDLFVTVNVAVPDTLTPAAKEALAAYAATSPDLPRAHFDPLLGEGVGG
jgi:molecular chaperone DnaJ